MNKIFKIAVLGLAVLIVLSTAGISCGAEELEENEKRVTITGVVAENFQIIVDKEEVIEIGDTETGDEVAKLVGEKVKAKGILAVYPDASYLTIESYEVLK